MAHKLANGDYRHKGFLIRCVSVPCSTGWSNEWRIRGDHQFDGVKFDTLKMACQAIELAIAAPAPSDTSKSE